MAGKTYGQARQVVHSLLQGVSVLCIVRTKRQSELMRLLVEETLDEHGVLDEAHIKLLDLRCMEE